MLRLKNMSNSTKFMHAVITQFNKQNFLCQTHIIKINSLSITSPIILHTKYSKLGIAMGRGIVRSKDAVFTPTTHTWFCLTSSYPRLTKLYFMLICLTLPHTYYKFFLYKTCFINIIYLKLQLNLLHQIKFIFTFKVFNKTISQ